MQEKKTKIQKKKNHQPVKQKIKWWGKKIKITLKLHNAYIQYTYINIWINIYIKLGIK